LLLGLTSTAAYPFTAYELAFGGSDQDYRRFLAGVAVFCFAVGVLSSLGLAITKQLEKKGESHASWIEPMLENLYLSLREMRDFGDDCELRICVYAPDEKRKEWVQITTCVGDGSFGQIGHRTPRSRGMCGLAVRQPMDVLLMMSKEPRVDFFVRYLNFERHEVSQASGKTNSWAAMCVGEPNKIHVVLYAECTERRFFGKQDGPRAKLLKATGFTLAQRLGCR
jgi:hypothetical protein